MYFSWNGRGDEYCQIVPTAAFLPSNTGVTGLRNRAAQQEVSGG